MASSSNEELTWMHVIVRVGLNAVTHPIEYGKILIQIGHEPLEPYKSRTIFGRGTMFYPSIFSYIRHIARRDGFTGCYRGLAPKLCANVLSGLTFQKTKEQIKFPQLDDPNICSDDLTMEERTQRCIQNTVRESMGRVAAIIVSQPFHVIAVRTMAEFVGQDGKYVGIIASFKVIYHEEGIKGFFSGLVPRILCDLGSLWLANTAIHFVNNQLVEDKDLKSYIRASIRFMASAVMYPLQVISNCMAVTGSSLQASSPPNMPYYTSWLECYRHLKKIKGLTRGSSLLWRTYTGSTIMINDDLTLPSQTMFRPPPKKAL